MYERLERISDMISESMEHGDIAGASVAVLHNGSEVYRGNFGFADMERGIKMSDNTIFRMFSMTKPVTACAAMILMEKGMLDLNYPLKWFVPTFSDVMVEDEKGARKPDRDILIKDLLSMTSGICYPDTGIASGKMGELWGRVSSEQSQGLDSLSTHEFAVEMGKIPLAFTPGERWMYGASADVMGAVIEECSGMKLSDFMAKEIFEPLEMIDTGFYIPEDKYGRLACLYQYNQEKGGLVPFDTPQLCLTDYRKPPAFESGGAGLVSTISDYEKFVQMLLNGGNLNGRRILGRKTVDYMTSCTVTEKQLAECCWESMRGYGYGNFMRILTDRTAAACNASLGEFGWDGWTGNYFIADRIEGLALLYFIQNAGAGTTPLALRLKNVMYSAV